MACGCSKSGQKEFVYIDANGKTSVHDNELKAKVAQIRAGGGGKITQRPKG
jgi:hypothetical protein